VIERALYNSHLGITICVVLAVIALAVGIWFLNQRHKNQG